MVLSMKNRIMQANNLLMHTQNPADKHQQDFFYLTPKSSLQE